jgi:Icc-related predicted phosphoesterase
MVIDWKEISEGNFPVENYDLLLIDEDREIYIGYFHCDKYYFSRGLEEAPKPTHFCYCKDILPNELRLICSNASVMTIDCISDLHGYLPKLEGGELLIVAGDLTKSDQQSQYEEFYDWLDSQPYAKKIVISGNHDNKICPDSINSLGNCSYLQDSGTEFYGLKIWGSPWTKSFNGMNPKCKAFTVDTDEELEEKWKLIPDDIDILITHCPPFGFFDCVDRESGKIRGYTIDHTGSKSLREHSMARIKPKLHVFGHIHEHGGNICDTVITKFVNASVVNERYELRHDPVRITL